MAPPKLDWKARIDGCDPQKARLLLTEMSKQLASRASNARLSAGLQLKVATDCEVVIAEIQAELEKIPQLEAQTRLLAPPPPKVSTVKRCPLPCGKIRFKSKDHAKKANASNDKSLHFYFDYKCCCYHASTAD